MSRQPLETERQTHDESFACEPKKGNLRIDFELNSLHGGKRY